MFENKTLLITGGTGSFGKTMVRSLLETGAMEVRVLSRDEEKQDALRNELGDDRVRFYIGDVRDFHSVERAIQGSHCVFHAAALKQVPSCEFFPQEAVRTNIMGSDNVIRAGIAAGVESLICLSTDKAVFPVNAMGMSKAMMEKLVQSAARELGTGAKTTLSSVRYGNVMYSRGSSIPLFIRQIKAGKPITITEPTMTRFLMPLRDSVALVMHAFTHANQGDLFVKKAPASTIVDLVVGIKELFGVPDHPVEIIGWRHAEKLYETLASAQELNCSEDMGDFFRIILDQRNLNYKPYFSEGAAQVKLYADYHSHNTTQLSIQSVKDLLMSLPEVQAELMHWEDKR
ncbi:SDR family NAD(P)-dependent oxidoreductase [Pseudopelagicola sp. nBUS_20]|uniref:SDR family NAD(P)-dependent oxidoreductase n=1 Tax=Pseudopelagicola sp. nBUS_20 TaxID=3395317 RepID=UPI003EBABB07